MLPKKSNFTDEKKEVVVKNRIKFYHGIQKNLPRHPVKLF